MQKVLIGKFTLDIQIQEGIFQIFKYRQIYSRYSKGKEKREKRKGKGKWGKEGKGERKENGEGEGGRGNWCPYALKRWKNEGKGGKKIKQGKEEGKKCPSDLQKSAHPTYIWVSLYTFQRQGPESNS